jgi:hypothetical protein
MATASILPVGFAIDRLEGDGIKINSWFTTPLCAAREGTASTTEAKALACLHEWWLASVGVAVLAT